jgi:hypothetical protein
VEFEGEAGDLTKSVEECLSGDFGGFCFGPYFCDDSQLAIDYAVDFEGGVYVWPSH